MKNIKKKRLTGVKEARRKSPASFIMRKISEDILSEACNELALENDDIRKSAAQIDKAAFDVSVNPASLVGALTGALIAKKKVQVDNLKRQMENESSTVLQGNYYSQVQNLIANLKIIFTPFGVVYVVRSGVKEITIETIGTDEMNTPMYTAWKSKDASYFKNLLLNKMYSEIQFVEQQFAKKMVENQMNLQTHITKKASEDIGLADMSFSEMLEKIAEIKDFYSKQSGATEKLAEILIKMSDEGEELRISWEFKRPLEKYAIFGGALDFLGFGGSSSDIRSLQGKYLSPSYLANRVKVGFLPDRVIFIVDNKVISSLLAMDMNSEAFDYFEKQNEKFFTDYFSQEAKKGIKRMKGKLPSNSDIMRQEKKAAEEKSKDNSIKTIFDRTDIHPVVYYKMLTEKYGTRWINWDVSALIKVLEQDFDLVEGMADAPFNKILSIHSVNNNLYPFSNYHVFEKIIRAFSGKPIDFLEREVEDLEPEDIALGLDIVDAITPKADTYKNFSSDVINYIIDNLIDKDCRVFIPISLFSDSKSRAEFFQHLNEYLLDGFNGQDIVAIDDDRELSKSIQENEIIHHVAMNILLRSRSAKDDISKAKLIRTEIAKREENELIKNIIDIQVVKGALTDRLLLNSMLTFKEQLLFYNLK